MSGTLYFECESGISGDMAVAAMLDLGADAESLRKTLGSLEVDGFRIEIRDVLKSGIRAKDFDVVLDQDNHDHDNGYLYGHDNHDHDHHHDHDHDHDGEHHHHAHRRYGDIVRIIEGADMTPRARGISLRILTILGEAESEAHGVPLNEVHFHEVGAVDSIVDIVSLGVCLDSLDPDAVCFSDLYEGTGTVRCQHGVMPVPVPAVVNIAKANSLPLRITDSAGEYVTPTGAAFAAAARTCQRPKSFTIARVGIGAGKRESERSGILRAMMIVPEPSTDGILKLECNVDDCTGEHLGYASERLFAAGARDVSFSPVFMKKGRPGWLLTVICEESSRERLEDVIFKETTTIGIRRVAMDRTVLGREMKTVDTEYGPIRVKVCTSQGLKRSYPEYEDVAKASRETGVPFREVYEAACRSALRVLRAVPEVHQDAGPDLLLEVGAVHGDAGHLQGPVDQGGGAAVADQSVALVEHRLLDELRVDCGEPEELGEPLGEGLHHADELSLEACKTLDGHVGLDYGGEHRSVAEVVLVGVEDPGPDVREGLHGVPAPGRDGGHEGLVVIAHDVLGDLEVDLLLGADVAIEVRAGPGELLGDGGQGDLVVRPRVEERVGRRLDLLHALLLLLGTPGPYEIRHAISACRFP